ncbi:MAG TPA: YkgJ family cysteine cluster protein, partial [Myxococcaceae bacterium]|nr:YkgJ family cysteine cluster protein [Myxococcaceae bacterium]
MATHPEGAARLARERYLELSGKVDQFFERVHARYGAVMQCRAGCSACCQAGLSVTSVEASLLREGLATLPAEVRERLARQAREEEPKACPALDAEGRCLVYAWRPLVCRSHGVPIRQREPAGVPDPEAAGAVSACEKNFEGGALLPSIAADCVL